MTPRALHELEPAAEWRAGDIADPAAWTLRLSADDHAELDAALAAAKRKSVDPLELEREDFPSPCLAPKFARRRGHAPRRPRLRAHRRPRHRPATGTTT